jgi:hypothetical protein
VVLKDQEVTEIEKMYKEITSWKKQLNQINVSKHYVRIFQRRKTIP